MHNILIVGTGLNKYSDIRFREEATKLGANIVDYYLADKDLEFKATLNRRYLANLIRYQQGKQVNDIVKGIFWKDKVVQLTALDLPCKKPRYLVGEGLSFNLIADTLNLPFIAKVSRSSQGNGVFMVRDITDFEALPKCEIFEEVIWNSLGKDLRVFTIRGEVKACMLRQNDTDFKSNFHQGGKGTNYEINDEVRSIAREIYKNTQLDVCGIDLLLDNKEYVFCELNVNPGFNELEHACNYNAAKDIIKMCLE